MMQNLLIHTNNVSHVESLSNNYKIQKRDVNYSEYHRKTYSLYMMWPECRVRKYAKRWKMLSFQYDVIDRVS